MMKKLGPESFNVSLILYSLGGIYKDRGELDTSLEHFKKALIIMTKLFKPESAQIADILDGIGLAYRDNGEFEQALEHFKKCL